MTPQHLLGDPVLSRDGFRCVYCGQDLLEDVDTLITFCRDHLVPRSKGGPFHESNLVTACAACDKLKSGRPATSIQEARKVIGRERAKWLEVYARLVEMHRRADAETLVSVANHLDGTLRQFKLPVEPEEAIESCTYLDRVSLFIRACAMFKIESALAASISYREQDTEVAVHFHPEPFADPFAARAELAEVESGDWDWRLEK
jgi:hypothetical protein